LYIKTFYSTLAIHRQITTIMGLQSDCTATPLHAYSPAMAGFFQHSKEQQQHNQTPPTPTGSTPLPQQLTTCICKRK
jgi:hypothetical protein